MRYTCFYVPGVTLVYSGKSPLQTAADINFCDEARKPRGSAYWGVSRCGPVARGGSSRPCRWLDI
jgi:hypothetical protein